MRIASRLAALLPLVLLALLLQPHDQAALATPLFSPSKLTNPPLRNLLGVNPFLRIMAEEPDAQRLPNVDSLIRVADSRRTKPKSEDLGALVLAWQRSDRQRQASVASDQTPESIQAAKEVVEKEIGFIKSGAVDPFRSSTSNLREGYGHVLAGLTKLRIELAVIRAVQAKLGKSAPSSSSQHAHEIAEKLRQLDAEYKKGLEWAETIKSAVIQFGSQDILVRSEAAPSFVSRDGLDWIDQGLDTLNKSDDELIRSVQKLRRFEAKRAKEPSTPRRGAANPLPPVPPRSPRQLAIPPRVDPAERQNRPRSRMQTSTTSTASIRPAPRHSGSQHAAQPVLPPKPPTPVRQAAKLERSHRLTRQDSEPLIDLHSPDPASSASSNPFAKGQTQHFPLVLLDDTAPPWESQVEAKQGGSLLDSDTV